jgi:PQQ-dependent dehydrogenase (methanol/ethanol family)
MRMWILVFGVYFAFTASLCSADSRTGVEADTQWSLPGGNAEMQHYSPLTGIDANNVSHLGLAWFSDVFSKDGLLDNPLVVDGVVYLSGVRSRIWAIDVRNGKLLWEFDPKVRFDGSFIAGIGAQLSRGIAVWGRYVYVGTTDCRLVAVDRKTGTKAWEATTCEASEHVVARIPRVGGGKVFIGTANEDSGQGRPHVDAFDAKTGKHVWRFYTIPGDPKAGFENKAMEMAAKTWRSGYWRTTSGGSVWDGMTYDPKLNLLYFGTDGPTPQNPPERGKDRGDELFTNAIVAVKADTGEYVWHYSTTPGDGWDYNADMPIMIADLQIGGTPRRVVMEAPKNGFFYVLDAPTGRVLAAGNIVPVNWASRVDLKTGRPVELPDARYWELPPGQKIVIKPGGWGAHSWHAMSFSPKTALVYIPATPLPMVVTITESAAAIGGHVHLDWLSPLREPEYKGKAGRLLAWDPVAQKARWSVTLPFPMNGGVLSTGSNLVFQGTASGEFVAYEATTGKKLWSMDTHSSIQSAPTTVEVDGRQLILVPTGLGGGGAKLVPEFLGEQGRAPPRLMAFALGGHAQLPPVPAEPQFEKPPRPRPTSTQLVQRGSLLFESIGCYSCHGSEARRHVGLDSVPDLRRASAQTHDQFLAIVMGGLRQDKGMPVFAGKLSIEDAQAIEAYVLSEAWDAYDAQNSQSKAH